MKKGLWKRIAALSLAALMSLGIAACNGGDGDDAGGGGGGASSKTNQAGKQNVYSFQEFDLFEGNGKDSGNNILEMSCLDDKLYLLVYSYEYDEEGNEKNNFGYYKSNVDGSDKSWVELERSDREENHSWINNTLISSAGYIYAVENSSYQDNSDPDNPIYEDRYYLTCWDMNGAQLWSERIDANTDEEWSYCQSLRDGGEGKALALMGGSKYEMVLYSTQGEELSRKEMSGDIFDRAGMMYTKEDGTLMVVTYDEEYTKRTLVSYDIETGTTGEEFDIPFSDNFNITRGSGNTLLLTDSLGVYTWKPGDAEPKMMMSIVNSDLPASNMNYVQIIDDQHFVALYNNLTDWEQRGAYFTYVDPADIPDKETLVLGGVYIGSDIKARVIDFNKNSDRYRITLKDYVTYNTGTDWMAGQNRLNSDIISGQMPDIMLLSDMNSYGNYISKGVLADIGSLLAADPELGKLEYLQNVWDAYSVNGKLYAVIPSFNVRTMVAKKSLVGEPDSWTMADVEAVLATMPEGAKPFGDMVRDSYIYYMMSYGGQDFVNMETGKCSFDSQGFMDMLEFAKTLPKEYSDDYWEDYDYNYHESQYRENRSLLYDLYINNIKDCKYQLKGYIGEEVSFVGFPTADSNGSVLNSSNYSFMLSAKSKQLDGAWQFVRQFLTEEYQTGEDMYSMPVLKSAFLAKAQEAMERSYWVDEDGNKQYYDDTWYINGEEVVLEPFTQEEVDRICEFIYTVRRTSYYNEDIRNIILEEAEAFFTGQKSVQEVANIIQSRAQIFVNENR